MLLRDSLLSFFQDVDRVEGEELSEVMCHEGKCKPARKPIKKRNASQERLRGKDDDARSSSVYVRKGY